MTKHTNAPRLSVEPLEDRLTPAGTQIPAGEFNWTQFSPSGELTQLIWEGQSLVYRTRAANAWQPETVATTGTFTATQYDTRDQVQKATQSAQLVFTSDGTPHVFFLDPQWVWQSNAYQTTVAHYARVGGRWQQVESITTPWLSTWGPSNLIAEAGANNTLHLMFAETYNPATGVGNFGSGILWYGTNKTGGWTFDRISDTADLKQDVWFTGGRWAPRFFSMAIDSQNNAHVTFTPQFHIAGAFSTVYSELKYATNRSGSWKSETVMAPQDGTADAGLGASVAIGPRDSVAVASYYVDRYATGSPLASKLMYHVRHGDNNWAHQDVTAKPDGYVAGDGASFTGFAPQLYFDAAGQPNIVFSDEAGQHNPQTYANEVAGQIRTAVFTGGRWQLNTVYRQSNPLANQLFFPVAATHNGQTVYAGLEAVSSLDGNANPTGMSFGVMGVNTPAGPATPAPTPPPAGPPTNTPTNTPLVLNSSTPKGAISKDGLIVGSDAGPVTTIVVYKPDGSVDFSITPFGDNYSGGARVVHADVTGDGVKDYVVGSGGELQARVRVWDGVSRKLILDTTPFEGFGGGLVLAAGDVNGDRVADLVIGPDVAGGPRIKILAGGSLTNLLPDFYGLPYPEFRGGLRLASADINRDGYAEVVVAPGEGGGPRVTVFDGASFTRGQPRPMINDFFVFDSNLRTGLYLTAGDIDGDGHADIVAGSGEGGGPRVRVIGGASIAAGSPAATADFFAGSTSDRGGVRVSAVKYDDDAKADLLVGAGSGSAAASTYSGFAISSSSTPAPAQWFDTFPGTTSGVFVG
ncbi:MAG TPA: VCBS repeat-containing protein [Gemmataceae bacterium]|nr:VCBS repeat-containing protein [Gemmataceae bacterium]